MQTEQAGVGGGPGLDGATDGDSDGDGIDMDAHRAAAGLMAELKAATHSEQGSGSPGDGAPATAIQRARTGQMDLLTVDGKGWGFGVGDCCPPPAASGQFGGTRGGTQRLGDFEAVRGWYWASKQMAAAVRALRLTSARAGHA